MSELPKVPLIILVSGTPGSGKTTLARNLANHMHLLHIPRDEFNWSLTYTAGMHVDKPKIGVPKYYETLKYIAGKGASTVTDGTLYKGVSENDVKKLARHAQIINVHCRSKNERERFYQREVAFYGDDNEWLTEHMKYLESIYDQTVDPLELDCPCIEVDTSEGYNPSIEDIATRIGDRNSKLKLHPFVAIS